MCGCPERPEDGAGSPGAGLRGSCEPYSVGAGKSSELSCHLSGPHAMEFLPTPKSLKGADLP